MVAASLLCPTFKLSFPGSSFQIESANTLKGSVKEATNLTVLLYADDSVGNVNLPENFAPTVDSNASPKEASLNNGKCSEPVAVVFHAVKNAKLFQSVAGDRRNLKLPSQDVVLGNALRVINSVVVSATVISEGLNTSSLHTDMEFLLEETINLVSGHRD